MSEIDEQQPDTDTPEPQEPQSDPFEGWPAAESSAVIEDAPADGVSVEHVRGEIEVPDGYTVLEGTPLGQAPLGRLSSSRASTAASPTSCCRVRSTRSTEAGVSQDAITVVPVPGAFELPLAAMALAKTRRYACIVALGAIVRGETPHFDYVAPSAPPASSSPRSRPACRSPSACSPSTPSSRPRRGSTRPPRPCARRSRWPTCSPGCGPAPASELAATLPPAMSKICAICGKKPGVREPPLALDGRDEAPVRPEPPARPDAPQRLAAARLRLHPLPQGRQGHQSRLG